MGGEITLIDLSNGQHQVNLLVYRDTVGIPMQSSATFDFSGPNGQSFSRTVTYDSIISGNLLPMYPYGVEIYLFTDTVTIPSIGLWHVSWSNCCRNGAIQNLSNPLNESMYLSTTLEIDSVLPNSTAFFLVPAAIYLPLNTAWQYNPLPFDPDGDSLVWSLDQPQSDSGVYCAAYSTPPAAANNPLTLDSATGTISWTANTVGHFVISILVDQYRNGVWIGEVRRDMQLIVVPASTGFPFWSSMNNMAPRDTLTVNVPANTPLNFEIIASHSDSTKPLYMEAYSPLFQNPNNAISFNVTAIGQANDIKGTFNFTPDSSHVHQNHLVVFRCSDRFFTTDQTMTIAVSSGIGLKELQFQQDFANWQVYPNPAQNFVGLSFEAEESHDLKVRLLSISGKESVQHELKAQYGTNLFWLETESLEPGIYLLQVEGEDGALWTERILKQ